MEQRQLGGFGFLVGNAALLANGLIASLYANTPQSRKAGVGRMVSSVLWSAGGAFLARYGDRSVAAQQERLEQKLADFLKQENVPLDAAMLAKADAHQREGWFGRLEDFFYAHPIECTNAYNALAAGGFLASGLLRRSDGNVQAGNANIGLSGLVLTGALASILIPEKTPAQIEAAGQAGTWWGQVQEKPLSYVRWLFLAADALAGMEAIGEFKSAKALPVSEPYRKWQFGMSALSVTAMVTMMVSDWLTSGSKKTGGAEAERSAAQQQIVKAAAQHLASLPPAAREQLGQKVAYYLSTQPELRFADFTPGDVMASFVPNPHRDQPGQGVLGAYTERLALNTSPTHQAPSV